ncbi:MAG: hypothetical protein ACLGHQ_02845 [Acidimicrobiia bacterium]
MEAAPNRPNDTDQRTTGRSTEAIDEQYSEVDPEDVAENAIDYFSGDPETKTEKAGDERRNGERRNDELRGVPEGRR